MGGACRVWASDRKINEFKGLRVLPGRSTNEVALALEFSSHKNSYAVHILELVGW